MLNKILGVAAIISLAGCTTLTNDIDPTAHYLVNVQRANGGLTLRMLTTGKNLNQTKNKLCRLAPDAQLTVFNQVTNEEVMSQAKNCNGKSSSNDLSQKNSLVPQTFNLNNQTYTLKHQQSNNSRAQFAYTLASETVNNWQRMLTLIYAKNKPTPEQWQALQMQTLKQQGAYEHVQFSNLGQVSYFSVTYLPVNLKSSNPMESMYEVNVQKNFFNCKGLVSLAVAQRISATTPNLASVLKQSTDKIKLELENSSWQPNCDYSF